MSVLAALTAKGGPVDQARCAAEAIGARPYRVFLCWSVWRSGEIGRGREEPLLRYEIRPRPKVVGYAGLTRNPAVIGNVDVGTVRVTEVPLWLPQESLLGLAHPELKLPPANGPEDKPAVDFRYEVEVDERDPTATPDRFRLDARPERDEEGAQWLLVLARQSVADR